jgi:hypothetical protein
MPANAIVATAFSVNSFKKALAAASGADPSHWTEQIDYLARYCKRLGAQTVVREEHYIDRHFLDEHALYYCRNFHPPPNHVRRFHLFVRSFTEAELSSLFTTRAEFPMRRAVRVEEALSRDYLGFISIRPIPAAPVGRTVLRRLEDGERRDIWATGSHDVHLANLTLRVNGLAFQQQDVAVGACATAALWSALSRVSRNEGMRAPTPAEVSESASRHFLANGRTLPAVAGLTVEQLSEAIRCSGFAPEAVRADAMPEFFVIALHTYLLSGIPVVLALLRPDGGHAVTAVGFQTARAPDPLLQTSIPVRSARMKKIYIHDDRLGPYARSFLRPMPRTEEFNESLLLQIEMRRADEASSNEPDPAQLQEWVVDSALAPVYPKLRLPVRSLITLADLLGDLVERLVGAENAPRLSVEFYYERSGTYLSKLNGRLTSGAGSFFREVALPRWCGIIRWFIGEKPLVEFVYDTTDILRDERQLGAELLRAVVCLDAAHHRKFRDVATFFWVPYA